MTYSLATIGFDAGQVFPPALKPVSSQIAPLQISDVNALPGAQQNAMQTGTQVLCKLPDGSQAYYTFDAERSTPGYPVMKRVSP